MLLILSVLTGCQRINTQTVTPTYEEEQIQEILDKSKTSESAKLYEHFNVYDKSISIIFEGFSDEETIMRLADLLQENKIETIMFIPGAQVEAHPDVIKYIKDRGIEVGNYGLTGEEDLASSSDKKITRQIYISNQYYKQAINETPEVFYATRSKYTESMLKIIEASDMKAGVLPTVFLNYKSFTSQDMATGYTENNHRGDIISFKLNGELNETEVENIGEEETQPAIDKQPTIVEEETQEELQEESQDIVQVVEWFIEGCEINQVKIRSLEEMQEKSNEEIQVQEVSQETQEKLEINLYPNLTTDFEFGIQESQAVEHSYFNDAVFIGDSIMEDIEEYVLHKRQTNQDYLGTAQFLAMGGLSARNALWEISDTSRHPIYNGERIKVQDGVAAMGNIKKVYLLLGANDILLTDSVEHLKNYHTLLQLIKEQSPQVEFYVMSITPGTDIEELEPNNKQIFERNLSMIYWCEMYAYHYIDVATVLRNETGGLPTQWCVDTGGQGRHLNEQGIEVLLNYLLTHTK